MKVSVVIPTYNRANLIVRTIQSVIEQTEKDLEILICDDCSTDNTYDIINSIGDPRIKWLPGKERFGGPAVPRNRGIANANGEWIAVVDSDDTWVPQKLEKQLYYLNLLNYKASSSFIKGEINNNILPKVLSFKEHFILGRGRLCCSSVIIHKSIFEKVKGFPEEKSLIGIEDLALWFRVSTQTPIILINEPLVNYCQDPRRGSIQQFLSKPMLGKMIFNNFLTWANSNNQDEKLTEFINLVDKELKHNCYL